MVGVRTEPRFAGTAVSGARIQHFASMVQDPNPAYWDAEFATRGVGRPRRAARDVDGLADSAAVAARRSAADRRRSPSAFRCPVPRSSTPPTTSSSLTPILEGDRLNVVEEVVSVSPEKTTRLGVGHFVETCDSYHRDDGSLLAIEPKHVVPLHACGVVVTSYRRLSWDDVAVPTDLAEVVDVISYQRVVMNPGATWDYFPGHYRPCIRPKPRPSDDFREHDAHRGFHRQDRDRLGGALQPGGAPQGVAARLDLCGGFDGRPRAGGRQAAGDRQVTPAPPRGPRDRDIQPARRTVLSGRGDPGALGLAHVHSRHIHALRPVKPQVQAFSLPDIDANGWACEEDLYLELQNRRRGCGCWRAGIVRRGHLVREHGRAT